MTTKPVQRTITQPVDARPVQTVLQSGNRGLRTQRTVGTVPGDQLKRRVLTQPVGVVGVFLPGDDLI